MKRVKKGRRNESKKEVEEEEKVKEGRRREFANQIKKKDGENRS